MAEQPPPIEISAEKIPEIIPILPLFDTALFPKMVLPLIVMQVESIQLIDDAMSKDRIIGLLVSKKKTEDGTYSKDDLSTVGTVALILKMAKIEDDKAQLLVQGLSRFKIKSFVEDKPYRLASVEPITDIEKKD